MNHNIHRLPDFLPLRKAGPYWGVPVPHRTLEFWAQYGVSNRKGGRIKLRITRVGGRCYVAKEDAVEFQRAIDKARRGLRLVGPTPEERRRARKDHLDAVADLRRQGVIA